MNLEQPGLNELVRRRVCCCGSTDSNQLRPARNERQTSLLHHRPVVVAVVLLQSVDMVSRVLRESQRVMAERLVVERLFAAVPDQVIANEYLTGQGISAHVDCEPCFGEVIASLSLLSACEMQFHCVETGEARAAILPERSLLVLAGAARRDWTHAIPARRSDSIDGVRVMRQRRVSLTFRTMRF